MDEERFNISLRRLLKQFGTTAQREIEKAVYAAQQSGALASRSLPAGADHHAGRGAAGRYRGRRRDRAGMRRPGVGRMTGRLCGGTAVAGIVLGAIGCGGTAADERGETRAPASPIAAKLAQYTPVRLTADLGGLSDSERRMLPLLIEAAQEMDTIFWQQVYSPRDSLAWHGPRLRDPPLRHPELRSLGPARRQHALRRRRGHSAAGRGVLPPRHHQGGVRARGRGLTGGRRGSAEPLHARAPGAPAVSVPCPYHEAFAGPLGGAPPRSCARPRSWPRTRASASTSSSAPGHSRPTTIGPAIWPGWT